MEDKSYLEEGFDARSLKVAELRGILHEYEIKFPSNAKKQQLLKLFNSEIKPRAKQLFEAHKNAIKNSNDDSFIDVRNQDGESNDESGSDLKTEREHSRRDSASKRERVLITEEIVKSEDNEISEIETAKEESRASEPSIKKEESPFINDNVFQTPDNSLELSHKKRRHEDDLHDLSKRVKSATPDVAKSIFDSSSDSEVDNFQASIIERTPLRVKKARSKNSTPTSTRQEKNPKRIDQEKHKNSTSPTHTLSSSRDKKLMKMENDSMITKPQESLNQDESIINTDESIPSQYEDTTNFIAKSLEDEEVSFDRNLRHIKKMDPIELASELGITIEGRSDTTENVLDSNTPRVEMKRPYAIRVPSIQPVELDGNPNNTNESGETSDNELSDEEEEEEEEEEKEEKEEDNEEKEVESSEESVASVESEDGLNKLEADIKEGYRNLSKLTKHKRQTSPFAILSFISIWILLISASLFGYWYREQTILVGYCGNEINHSTFPLTEKTPDYLVKFGDYLDTNFKPICKPCPLHARCYPNLQIGCYEDFIEYSPWYSFIIPTEKSCVPDTKRAEKLEIMIDVALDLLRSKNADRNCGRSPKEDLEAGISLDDLHDVLLSMKAPYITLNEFEDLWERSIVELEKEPEIIVRQVTFLNLSNTFNEKFTNTLQTNEGYNLQDKSTYSNNSRKEEKKNKILRSTSLSNIGLKCQLQNSLVEIIFKIRYYILSFIGIVLAFKLLAFAVTQRRLQSYKIETIYGEVLKKLVKQRSISKEAEEFPPYIGVIQLRDLILVNEKNLTKRNNLWNKVSKKIETNSNVRSKLIENHGEMMKVWEWISDLDINPI